MTGRVMIEMFLPCCVVSLSLSLLGNGIGRGTNRCSVLSSVLSISKNVGASVS